tara:strand:+ start:563 stop:1351 length:789 start_codon:yes stop_codon:yes gene_type:complete
MTRTEYLAELGQALVKAASELGTQFPKFTVRPSWNRNGGNKEAPKEAKRARVASVWRDAAADVLVVDVFEWIGTAADAAVTILAGITEAAVNSPESIEARVSGEKLTRKHGDWQRTALRAGLQGGGAKFAQWGTPQLGASTALTVAEFVSEFGEIPAVRPNTLPKAPSGPKAPTFECEGHAELLASDDDATAATASEHSVKVRLPGGFNEGSFIPSCPIPRCACGAALVPHVKLEKAPKLAAETLQASDAEDALAQFESIGR